MFWSVFGSYFLLNPVHFVEFPRNPIRCQSLAIREFALTQIATNRFYMTIHSLSQRNNTNELSAKPTNRTIKHIICVFIDRSFFDILLH